MSEAASIGTPAPRALLGSMNWMMTASLGRSSMSCCQLSTSMWEHLSLSPASSCAAAPVTDFPVQADTQQVGERLVR